VKKHPWFNGPEPKHQREIRENGGKPIKNEVKHPRGCLCTRCKRK
jgi:hypothetical protein